MIEDTLYARARAIAVGLLVLHWLGAALVLLSLLAFLSSGCTVRGRSRGGCFWYRLKGYVDHFIVHDALWPHSGRGNVECAFDRRCGRRGGQGQGVDDIGSGGSGGSGGVSGGGGDGGGRRKGVSGRGRSGSL